MTGGVTCAPDLDTAVVRVDHLTVTNIEGDMGSRSGSRTPEHEIAWLKLRNTRLQAVLHDPSNHGVVVAIGHTLSTRDRVPRLSERPPDKPGAVKLLPGDGVARIGVGDAQLGLRCGYNRRDA